MVRMHLDYAIAVWYPYKKNSVAIEKDTNDNLKMATTFNNHFMTQFTQDNLDRIPDPVNKFE